MSCVSQQLAVDDQLITRSPPPQCTAPQVYCERPKPSPPPPPITRGSILRANRKDKHLNTHFLQLSYISRLVSIKSFCSHYSILKSVSPPAYFVLILAPCQSPGGVYRCRYSPQSSGHRGEEERRNILMQKKRVYFLKIITGKWHAITVSPPGGVKAAAGSCYGDS